MSHESPETGSENGQLNERFKLFRLKLNDRIPDQQQRWELICQVQNCIEAGKSAREGFSEILLSYPDKKLIEQIISDLDRLQEEK